MAYFSGICSVTLIDDEGTAVTRTAAEWLRRSDCHEYLLEACHKARAFLAGSIEETDQPLVEAALRDAIRKAESI